MKPDLKDLPPLSPLAPLLLELSWEDDDAERRLLQVVESDPALGARLLATANSVAFAAPGVQYRTLVSAVRRLGLRRAIHLATALLFAGSFRRLPASFNRALWLHALAMANAAQELARIKQLPEPHAAYFVGLVHDLGYLAMEYLEPGCVARVVAEAAGASLNLEEAELRIFGMEHHATAARLLEQWGVPEELVAPVRDHHCLDLSPDSLAAVLFGSEKLARCATLGEVLYAGHEHPFAPLAIDPDGIAFLLEQQLGLDESVVTQVTQRMIDQVAALHDTAAAMQS